MSEPTKPKPPDGTEKPSEPMDPKWINAIMAAVAGATKSLSGGDDNDVALLGLSYEAVQELRKAAGDARKRASDACLEVSRLQMALFKIALSKDHAEAIAIAKTMVTEAPTT